MTEGGSEKVWQWLIDNVQDANVRRMAELWLDVTIKRGAMDDAMISASATVQGVNDARSNRV
jgi:hypothetical protein